MSRNSKSELEFFFRRLDEVRMSERERIRAKAHLQRAEAVADLLASAASAIGGLFGRLVARPPRRRVSPSAHWG